MKQILWVGAVGSVMMLTGVLTTSILTAPALHIVNAGVFAAGAGVLIHSDLRNKFYGVVSGKGKASLFIPLMTMSASLMLLSTWMWSELPLRERAVGFALSTLVVAPAILASIIHLVRRRAFV